MSCFYHKCSSLSKKTTEVIVESENNYVIGVKHNQYFNINLIYKKL